MKLKILIISFFIFTNNLVDYSPLSIKQLINQAEIIAKCEIVSMDEKTFTVKFIDVIKGKTSDKLRINKFKNWTCASRALNYKVGQTELIFLTKEKNGWQALGAGNEGEIFMKKDIVYYRQYTGLEKPDDHFEIESKKLRGIIFEYQDVKDAINYYLQNSSNFNYMTQEEKKSFKSENMFLVAIVRSINFA